MMLKSPQGHGRKKPTSITELRQWEVEQKEYRLWKKKQETKHE